ncbi:MAG: hypothetical protein V5A54_12640, partial [Haloarculaceae archaeon]
MSEETHHVERVPVRVRFGAVLLPLLASGLIAERPLVAGGLLAVNLAGLVLGRDYTGRRNG